MWTYETEEEKIKMLKECLPFIKMDWFTEYNADTQIDRIQELFEEVWLSEKIERKTYWKIWETAMNYLY